MADVYLSPIMRRLVAKYGNQLKGRRGVDPAIIAYDPACTKSPCRPSRKMGVHKCKTAQRKGDRHD